VVPRNAVMWNLVRVFSSLGLRCGGILVLFVGFVVEDATDWWLEWRKAFGEMTSNSGFTVVDVDVGGNLIHGTGADSYVPLDAPCACVCARV
jgi:hypothetical protein